jgi:hypothetical protein
MLLGWVEPYNPPNMKMQFTAIFCLLAICTFHIIKIGRNIMARSVIEFITELNIQIVTELIHVPYLIV